VDSMSDIRGRTGPNVRIYRNVRMGTDVTIGDNTIIYENVEIGDGCFVGPNCILGEPLAAFYHEEHYENPPLRIGRNSIIRSESVLYAGSTIGDGFQTGHKVTIREQSQFGSNCRVGTLSDIQGYVNVGNYCRFHSNVHIGQRSTIKDYVWIYPYVVLTNDPHPPSECIQGPTIDEYAVIATGAIIMPGVKIGRDSLVAAQALVNKDVPPFQVVAGVPAKVLCSIRDIRCKEGKLQQPYPWKNHYSKGYPWQEGYDNAEGSSQPTPPGSSDHDLRGTNL
jgi:acetyltransferase-like isoleucine patch superfamily enzyme